MAEKSTQKKIADPTQNILYVVLHGLVCLFDNGTGFTGYLLDRSKDTFIQHVYKAGNFGKEDDLENSETLQLNGVDTGSAKLPPQKNPILKNPNPQEDLTFFPRNKIYLPRPNAILHFVCGDPGANLKDNNELVEKHPLISGVRVFQYTFKDYKAVNVSGDPFSWKCPDTATAIFHLYNEPEVDPGGVKSLQHSLSEFNDSVGFMQEKSKVQLTNAIVAAKFGDARPPDLPAEQVSALAVRDRVAAIVKKQQRRIPLKKEEEFLITYGKDDRGGAGGTQVCGGING